MRLASNPYFKEPALSIHQADQKSFPHAAVNGIAFPVADSATIPDYLWPLGMMLTDRLNRNAYSVREFSKELAKLPLKFEPGTHYQYGYSHDVLGAVIESISGKPFEEYMKCEVFLPLGTENTGYFLEDLPGRTLSGIYSRTETGLVSDPIDDMLFSRRRGFASGGGGVLSTLEDLTKFATILSTGGSRNNVHLLGRKTIDLMRAAHLHGQCRDDFRFATYHCNWELLQGYSYGLGVRTLQSLAESGINGSVGEFGWGSMAGSFLLCDPQEELSICYTQQLHPPKTLENYYTPRIKAIVYGALD